jgi:hypothetical protein
MDEVEALCDEICILKKGNTEFYGTVDEAIKNSPYDKFEDAYIWCSNEEVNLTFRTMLKTELKLSIGDKNVIIFAIIMPLIVLVIVGVIYGSKPAFSGAGYSFTKQSFGALCTISI